MKRNKKVINLLKITILVILCMFMVTSCSKKEEVKPQDDQVPADSQDASTPEEKPEDKQEDTVITGPRNPLTGLAISDSAAESRPVAIMVENSAPARPQWGMDDEKYSPDIILEAEIEYGITRTMWMFADFNSLPEIMGPVRSARPPFVMFSQLFDCIYVHWGQSESLGDYIGADAVIAKNGINNINQLTYRGKTNLFARSNERKVALEHTGIVYGDKLPQAIEDYGYRTKVNTSKLSKIEFNDTAKTMSDKTCNKIEVLISKRSWNKTWTYDSNDKQYHTKDFNNNLKRDNILVLMDETEYITKPGASFSYCNYSFTAGEGKLASLGTVTDIKWSFEKGKFVIQDKQGNPIKFNPGKTWIGWASSNNGGEIKIS